MWWDKRDALGEYEFAEGGDGTICGGHIDVAYFTKSANVQPIVLLMVPPCPLRVGKVQD